MDEREFEARVAGRTSAGDDPSAMSRFLDDFDASCPEAATGHLEAAHLPAMMSAAQLLAENGDPAARPASNAHGPAEQASGLPKLRRQVMNKLAGLTTGMKVAIGAGVLLFAFTGVALAGVLPHEVQHAVSSAAAVVGVSIPDPDPAPAAVDETATEQPEAAQPASDESSATAQDASDTDTETVDPNDPSGGQGDESVSPDQNDNSDQNSNADEQDGNGNGDSQITNPTAPTTGAGDSSDAGDAHPGASLSTAHRGNSDGGDHPSPGDGQGGGDGSSGSGD